MPVSPAVLCTSSPARSEGPLSGRTVPVPALDARQRARLLALMRETYEPVNAAAFARDLDAKDTALLLEDPAGEIQGFTALESRVVDGALIVYSGDTVVARAHWTSLALPRHFAAHVFGTLLAAHGGPAYWLLLSGGFRTYRYLPLFFREFVPRSAAPDPALLALRDALAGARFGSRFDALRGVVTLDAPTPVRPGLGAPDARDLADENVRFFCSANPGWQRGDELAGLASLSTANLTPAARRMLRT